MLQLNSLDIRNVTILFPFSLLVTELEFHQVPGCWDKNIHAMHNVTIIKLIFYLFFFFFFLKYILSLFSSPFGSILLNFR